MAMAIIVHFDLKVKQLNIINVFINAHQNAESPLVIYYLSDGFKTPKKLIKIN